VPAATTFEITTAVAELVQKPFDPAEFPYDILRIFRNTANSTIAKLKAGDTNPAHAIGGVLLKKYLFFKACGADEDPAVVGQRLLTDPITNRNQPRFLLITNGVDLYAHDTKTGETDNHKFAEEEYWSHFLLPLAPGHDRAPKIEEHPADIKAAKLLGRLYDAILKANPTWTAGNHTDALNHLMTRLLFCFYAEDTGIFATKNIFTEAITRYTQEDGSDLGPLLDRLFTIMNVEEAKRPAKLSPIEAVFPYVNGSLFEQSFPTPTFDRFARRQLLDCSNLEWTNINPDIFGSMIQTISDPNERANTGMHYTSVPNIMKVLNPLFLDELNEEYSKAGKSVSKLEALLDRLAKIRVFDPACGSGNFLIISYKELRSLETKTLQQIQSLTGKAPLAFAGVSIGHFYGIDIAPFACETAKLSLWIAEHKANLELRNIVHINRETLPLPKIETIHCANALRVDWDAICPAHVGEVFICGNPPYAGQRTQQSSQRQDIAYTFRNHAGSFGYLDVVACWFMNAARYIHSSSNSKAALVATNSICQGVQVALLWPVIYQLRVHVAFAYTSFKWSNNASNNAGVSCIIVGLAHESSSKERKIYHSDHSAVVASIGPYLIPNTTSIVTREQVPMSDLPPMVLGNKATDGGHLILSRQERDALLTQYPEAASIVRRYIGSDDFLNSIERFCLWITDDSLDCANAIPPIRKRIHLVRENRLESKKTATIEAAGTPHRFQEDRYVEQPALIVPRISSEARQYLQIGLTKGSWIVNAQAYAIYKPPSWLLAVLSSRLHNIWLQIVSGKLENRIQYSSTLVYNTFPVPQLSAEQQSVLAQHSKAILVARERHPGKTIAWLYNPETMPENVVATHQASDAFIEEHIYGRKFRDDMHRLEHLFMMYARMKAPASRQAPLFDITSKARKKSA
jgi:hypothetical protein